MAKKKKALKIKTIVVKISGDSLIPNPRIEALESFPLSATGGPRAPK